MSHASVLVAVSPEEVKKHGSIQLAVVHQMEPFDENGHWFKEGSRWDWWVIGGRFSGRFARPGYDPATDERNLETCFCCNGTGRRDDAIGLEARRHDPDYTCNGCGGKGKSLKHAGDWVDVGNVAARAELDEAAWKAVRRQKAEGWWKEIEKELAKNRPRESLAFQYGLKADDTKESFVDRYADKPISFYAFLKDRQWHEVGRMGWFGSKVQTECEVKSDKTGEPLRQGRCITRDEKTGARVYSWNKSKDLADEAAEDQAERDWERLYFERFLKDLPPETVLVVVDYHV